MICKQQVKEIKKAERIASKSRLMEKDVKKLVAAVDVGIIKRWKHAARRNSQRLMQ